MNILICNDDGIDSPALRQLVHGFTRMGDVYVVAPEGQRSSNSHHLTMYGRLRYEERIVPEAKKAYAIWGTPADCTHTGIFYFFRNRIDLVVSGVNLGANISSDIIYSGTVGAAREAHMYGLPALAVSIDNYDEVDVSLAVEYALKITESYLSQPDRTEYFLNVNVPYLSREDIKGIKVCERIGHVYYDDILEHEVKEGQDYIYFAGTRVSKSVPDEGLDIDINALREGYVTVSAIHEKHVSPEHSKTVEKIIADLK